MKDREMSREEAIKRLEEGAPFSELYERRWEDALALAIKALKDEPVVRCKDCVHRGIEYDCPVAERWLTDGDAFFCAWGERRETT